MPGDFVETLRIENFGCVTDVTLELTRLHALIGPNDSGKSTCLRAVRVAAELIRRGEIEFGATPNDGHWAVGSSRVTMKWKKKEVICWSGKDAWQIRAGTQNDEPAHEDFLLHPFKADIADPVRGAMLFRWDADAIRRPCELIPEGDLLSITERGHGVAAVYDSLLSRDRVAFAEIEDELRTHFPTVKGIWLPTVAKATKSLGVILSDGTRVQADEISEGLLYWLAFAILRHIAPTAILLIEEPENGLHPSRIADVMKVLRAISTRMQVILATHSPLVINELQPDEVTIITRDLHTGTRATRIDRTTHFRSRNKVYALGELWLSFADGDSESALVPPQDSSQSAG